MNKKRRISRVVRIGKVSIGGRFPVAIQSMVKAKTANVPAALGQIRKLQAAGCQIVRLAVKDLADARALKKIKQNCRIPVVADIHFNWRLGMEAIEAGVDKIRLNPGNIYKKEEVVSIARAARLKGIPIRVGVNSGSVRRKNSGLMKNKVQAQEMVKSALEYIKVLEGAGMRDIVVSLKASDIRQTVIAYRLMAGRCNYPFHLGVTATGPLFSGVIKSSIAIGSLLLEGIGDTIRISLTDEPQQEIKAAKGILQALGLGHFGPQIISCPTCGRCEVDLVRLVNDFERKLSAAQSCGRRSFPEELEVALMGCVVNGPGEAAEADLGVAFGKKEGILFKNGKPVRKVSFRNCITELLKEIRGKKR
jgi:(E)-4-hydroxy-3-methylbut-2-enyl-diphosphate synthase